MSFSGMEGPGTEYLVRFKRPVLRLPVLVII